LEDPHMEEAEEEHAKRPTTFKKQQLVEMEMSEAS
jgi:hypothetical protein